jgi:hypothetical protein
MAGDSAKVNRVGFARAIAVVTWLFSVPLFLTYQIKHTEFQPGYLFAALYSAGLLSVLVVPAFLCLEIVFFLLASHRHQKEAAKWYLSGAAVALLAETTFLIARTL